MSCRRGQGCFHLLRKKGEIKYTGRRNRVYQGDKYIGGGRGKAGNERGSSWAWKIRREVAGRSMADCVALGPAVPPRERWRRTCSSLGSICPESMGPGPRDSRPWVEAGLWSVRTRVARRIDRSKGTASPDNRPFLLERVLEGGQPEDTRAGRADMRRRATPDGVAAESGEETESRGPEAQPPSPSPHPILNRQPAVRQSSRVPWPADGCYYHG